jgi:NAD(P)-dependent dehydrogenase (short-subunit alcohol dehydrogenase family)
MSGGSLDGRRAVVTGAGSGNGAAIARRLAENGAFVTLLDRREDGLRDTLERWPPALRERGAAVVADITEDVAVEQAFQDLPSLDILVNNAGIVDGGAFPELDAATFARVLDVNLVGAYRCTRAAHPLLMASSHGRVINITSMEAHYLLATGEHLQPHYNASKAGLDLLTKALAFELGPSGVTVNAVAPGVIETPLTAGSLGDPEKAAWIVGCVPLERVGRAEDIAATVAFLASDDAEYVTGASIPVDGGFTLGWFRKAGGGVTTAEPAS